MKTLPDIGTCPAAGAGVNDWLHTGAIKLFRHLSAEETCEVLAAKVHGCGRTVSAHEIRRQVERGRSWAANGPTRLNWEPGTILPTSFESELRNLKLDEEARTKAISDGPPLGFLYDLSPYRDVEADDMIDALFPGNPWLCCGWTKMEFLCRKREWWRGEFERLQFIVPSPQMAQYGLNDRGVRSEHCKSNCGDRRFIVVEFDSGTKDEQSALLYHLNEFAPLALIVDSGGKSLHGWFYCYLVREEPLRKFFKYARSIGADHTHWTRSQFTRVPNGIRNGVRQHTYYFNPEAIK